MKRKFMREKYIRNRDKPVRICHGFDRDARERKETGSRAWKIWVCFMANVEHGKYEFVL